MVGWSTVEDMISDLLLPGGGLRADRTERQVVAAGGSEPHPLPSPLPHSASLRADGPGGRAPHTPFGVTDVSYCIVPFPTLFRRVDYGGIPPSYPHLWRRRLPHITYGASPTPPPCLPFILPPYRMRRYGDGRVYFTPTTPLPATDDV